MVKKTTKKPTKTTTKTTASSTLDRDKIQQVIGRYILEDQFRAAFENDPNKAVESMGLKLTAKELEALDTLRGELAKFGSSAAGEKLRMHLTKYADRTVI